MIQPHGPWRPGIESARPIRRHSGDQRGRERGSAHIQVWRKPFFTGEHSATRVTKYRYSGNVSLNAGYVNYCHHGTCVAAENMTRKCTCTGPRLTYYRLPVRRDEAWGDTCATSYWAVKRDGYHNCHDDSSVQVRAVRGLSYNVNGGRCSDRVFYDMAPNCDGQQQRKVSPSQVTGESVCATPATPDIRSALSFKALRASRARR